MKAKYIFVHETGAITTETVFYHVFIGNSDYGRRLLKRCQALQFIPGCFFSKADAATSDFLLKVAESLFPGVTLPLMRMKSVLLTEREFSKMINERFFHRNVTSPNCCDMLCRLDSRFYTNHRAIWKSK